MDEELVEKGFTMFKTKEGPKKKKWPGSRERVAAGAKWVSGHD